MLGYNQLSNNLGEIKMNVQEKISNQITTDAIVLYMKGTPQSPQCGFSGATVQLLKACGVQNFTAVDVLAEPEIRDGIKTYSNWPTVPQLYIKGEFVGGSDIVREMYEQGELKTLIDSAAG
jgi:monothiol glutaredoxin